MLSNRRFWILDFRYWICGWWVVEVMERIKVIVNPTAGRGRGRGVILPIERGLSELGVPFSLDVTSRPGEAVHLARQARDAGFATVVAAGGDGTVHEVVNGLAQAADAAGVDAVGRLAVLPIGSGNDMAAMSGVPLQLKDALQRLANPRTRRIDLGRINDRYFDNSIGAGFEAQVTVESHKIRRLRGVMIYLVAVFRALGSYPAPPMRVQWDDGEVHKRILMVSVGNSRRAGGGFYVTPDAIQDDGLLDLGIADALPTWRILGLLPRVMRGTHKNDPAIYLTRSTRIVVECLHPLPVHADGEVIYTDARRLEISVQPRRLEVVV